MTSKFTRIPLAIAMTSALAFAVGCSNDRTADDRAMAPNDPAVTAPPVATTDTMPANDMARTDNTMDGPDSEQPGTDTWITTKVKSSLLADSDVSGLDIEVETVNGVVTLSGQVDQQTQITEATRIAREIEGVTDVRTTALTVGANR